MGRTSPFRGEGGKVWNRRNLVTLMRRGEGPLTALFGPFGVLELRCWFPPSRLFATILGKGSFRSSEDGQVRLREPHLLACNNSGSDY
jgi:hypothetical protein